MSLSSQPKIPTPSTPWEMTEMVEEQANPIAPVLPLEGQLDEPLPMSTAVPPGLQEENQPMTTT